MQKNDTIEKTATWTTIVANVISIGSWLFSFFTAVALNVQPEPVSLLGVVEINGYYKLLFLVGIFLGYIHLLRVLWRSGKNVENSLGSFIYNSVINLKRPLVAAGFFLLIGTFEIVIFTETPELAAVETLLLLFALFFGGLVLFGEDFQGWIFIRLRYDPGHRQKWMKRIRKRLHEQGYVQTKDFTGMGFSDKEINWALKLYFEIYEFQQDLALNCYKRASGIFIYTREICELGFRSRMPKQHRIRAY